MNNNEAPRITFEQAQEALRNAPRRVLNQKTGRTDGHSPAPESTEGQVMTLKEAAAILGTSPDNLRGAIARGSLKAEKMGRDWFVQAKEVQRYAEQHRRRGPEAG